MEEAVKRAADALTYLREFHKLRFREIVDYRDREWVLELASVPSHENVTYETDEPETFLRVVRPNLTPAPAPDGTLSPWIEGDWRRPDTELRLKEARPDRQAGEELLLEEHPDVKSAWQAFIQSWRRWQSVAKIERDVLKLYDRLYDLRALFQREPDTYDLYVAEGVFLRSVKRSARQETIRHPLLLQRVELSFEAEGAKMTLGITGQSPFLFNGALTGAEETELMAFGSFRSKLEENSDIWPLAGEPARSFLKGLANSVGNGSFTEEEPDHAEGRPVIYSNPMLLVIKRGVEMAKFIDGALTDVTTNGAVSPALLPILDIHDEPDKLAESDAVALETSNAPVDEDETVFFTKPANAEQLRIVKRFKRTGRVVVEGPPGTGKTHTIANLIGHFLAEGKSVLVTAETTKALHVLREKVAPGLRPLCISVTDSDIEGREQLRQGVSELHRVRNEEELEVLERRAKALEAHRSELIGQLRQTRGELYVARHNEIVPIWTSGGSIKPIEAALYVREGVGRDDWIPGSIDPRAAPPLTTAELQELYSTNLTVSEEDEALDTGDLCELEMLPMPDAVEEVWHQFRELDELQLTPHSIDSSRALDNSTLQGLIDDVRNALRALGEPGAHWKETLVNEGWKGDIFKQKWQDALNIAQSLQADRQRALTKLLEYGLSGVFDFSDVHEAALTAIGAHLRQGGKLNSLTLLSKPAWRSALSEISILGRKLQSLDEVETYLHAIELSKRERAFDRLWSGLEEFGGLPKHEGMKAYDRAVQLKPSIESALEWADRVWKPVSQNLDRAGIATNSALSLVPPNVALEGDAQCARYALTNIILVALETAQCIQRKRELAERLAQMEQQVRELASKSKSDVYPSMVSALAARDTDGYRSRYDRYRALLQKVEHVKRRRLLLAQLSPFSSDLAAAIRGRIERHGRETPPGNWSEAWKWKQLDQELRRRDELSINFLNDQVSALKEELATCTAELAKFRAWVHLKKRITPEVAAALERYRQASNVVTGRRATANAKVARQAMEECANAVPVWIMPLSRVAMSFDPSRARFDVIIMDEASQIGVYGLAALHLAKAAIIVGDHRQTEPLAPGIEVSAVQALAGVHLRDIKGGALWDTRMSVYRLALGPYSGQISLLEHFRCVPTIISYSSLLAYAGKIKPLREAGGVATTPPVVHQIVPFDRRKGTYQRQEMEHIVSLLQSCSEQEEYRGATFGVVAMREDEKGYARAIKDFAREKLGDHWVESRKFDSKHPPGFQGDERNVIFMALADAPPELSDSTLTKMTKESNDELPLKRYNVAASRAQDQLWIISGFDKHHLKSDDIRFDLLDFAQNPDSWLKRATEENPLAESEFERLVYRDLTARGYRLTPQYPVGKFRIDLVAESNGKRCAIECDGDRYHGEDQLAYDMARQADLERVGNWKFIRIRGTRYFRDPEGSIEEVCAALNKLGVAPVLHEESQPAKNNSDLLERVLARAQEIRREWATEPDIDFS